MDRKAQITHRKASRRITLVAAIFLLWPGWMFSEPADWSSDHPRPQLERSDWINLNGEWEFILDSNQRLHIDHASIQQKESFSGRIRVPFPWQSKASGLNITAHHGTGWYRKRFQIPVTWGGEKARYLLNIGRSSGRTTQYVNGTEAGTHNGGYMLQTSDITSHIRSDRSEQVLVIRIENYNPTISRSNPPGMHPSISGIWGDVWLERSSLNRIVHVGSDRVQVRIEDPDPKSTFIIQAVGPAVSGPPTNGWPEIKLEESKTKSVRWTIPLTKEWQKKSWTPDNPNLIPLEVTLQSIVKTAEGDTTLLHDRVKTYIAPGNRPEKQTLDDPAHEVFSVDGIPQFLRGAGYESNWLESTGMPPSDEAIIRDYKQARTIGLNALLFKGIIPSPRQVYWADRLGIVLAIQIPPSRILEGTLKNEESIIGKLIGQYRRQPSIWMIQQGERPFFNESREDDDGDSSTLESVHGKLLKTGGFFNISEPRNSGSPNPASWRDYSLPHSDHVRMKADLDLQRSLKPPAAGWVNPWSGTHTEPETIIVSDFGRDRRGHDGTEHFTSLVEGVSLIRKLNHLAGFFWSDLYDTRELNSGLFSFDRNPKSTGLSHFSKKWTLNTLFNREFIGIEGPFFRSVKAGETIGINAFFVSSQGESMRPEERLQWTVRFQNSWGQSRLLLSKDTEIPVMDSVSPFTPVNFPELILGTPVEPGIITVTLSQPDGGSEEPGLYAVAVIKNEIEGTMSPLSSNLDRIVFRPGHTTLAQADSIKNAVRVFDDMFRATGSGYVEYAFYSEDLSLPSQIQKAYLVFEASPYPDHPDILSFDNSQRHGDTEWPSLLLTTINDVKIGETRLENVRSGPAGFLSRQTGVEAGFYGQLISYEISPQTWRKIYRAGKRKTLSIQMRFRPPGDSEKGGGLRIFGENFGAFAVKPHLLLVTGKQSPERWRQLTPDRSNPKSQINSWLVYGPQPVLPKIVVPEDYASDTWKKVILRETVFHGMGEPLNGYSDYPLLVFDFNEVFPDAEHNAEMVAVSYVYLPQSREVILWSGATDAWQVDVIDSENNVLPSFGSAIQWIGSVPASHSRKYEMTDGWNTIRIWSKKRNNGPWQATLSITDARGNIMDDVKLSTTPGYD